MDAGGAYTYMLTAADAGALMRASEKGAGPGGTTTANASSYFGPVLKVPASAGQRVRVVVVRGRAARSGR